VPTSFYIFLVCSLAALLPAYWDHGETWEEIKLGTGNKNQNILKLLVLWTIPILTIIGTVFLGIESLMVDKQQQQQEREYRDVTNSMVSFSNQLQRTNILARNWSRNALVANAKTPILDRLKDFLNSLDPKIVGLSWDRQTVLICLLKPGQVVNLQQLCAERGASQYIQIDGISQVTIPNDGEFAQTVLWFNTNFIRMTNWNIPELPNIPEFPH
jgi:hypothetical protein